MPSDLFWVLLVSAREVTQTVQQLALLKYTPQKWHLGNRDGCVVFRVNVGILRRCNANITRKHEDDLQDDEDVVDEYRLIWLTEEGARALSTERQCKEQQLFPGHLLHIRVPDELRTKAFRRGKIKSHRIGIDDEIAYINGSENSNEVAAAILGGEHASTAAPSSSAQVSRFTFIELFAGVGGFRIALEALGGHCVLASEIDADASAVYERNFLAPCESSRVRWSPSSSQSQRQTTLTRTRLELRRDVREVDPPRAASGTTLESSTTSPLDNECAVDLLVAGFPCQPFSNLGGQPGLQDEEKGTLFKEIVRFLQISKPRCFLLENVPGLLNSENGESLRTILRCLRHASVEASSESVEEHHPVAGPGAAADHVYDVSYQLVNANLLTAQNRNRLYFVGFRRDSSGSRRERNFQFPLLPDLGLYARDVVEELEHADTSIAANAKNCAPNSTEDQLFTTGTADTSSPNSTAENHQLLTFSDQQFAALQDSVPWKRYGPSSVLVWPDQKAGTIVSHYGHSASNGKTCLLPQRAPLNPRKFTPRECARFMGFGDEVLLLECLHLPSSREPSSRERGTVFSGTPILCGNGASVVPSSRERRSFAAMVRAWYRLLGNAVCPPVIAALAGAVLEDEEGGTEEGQRQMSGHARYRGPRAAARLALGAVRGDRRETVLARWNADVRVRKWLGII